MKSCIKSFMLIAAAALAFSSCNKEIEEQQIVVTNGTHTVNFTAVIGEQSKTTMTEGAEAATFAWSGYDEDHFIVYENNVPGETIGVIDGDIMKLAATFADGAEAPFTYTATLNGKVPGKQTLYDGKYDENSDVLIAEPITSQTTSEDFTFKFNRVVALNKMTLKGLGEDEIVTKVIVKADKGIVGSYDIVNDGWTAPADGSPTTEITIDGGEDEGVLIDNGIAVVYFNCIPVSDTQFTIDVTTDKGEYTKTFSKKITLVEGMLNRFNVAVEKKQEPTGYVKVTSEPIDWSGEYLLVYESSEETGLCWTGVDEGKCHVDVVINDGVIETKPNGAVTLTIASMEGGYSIKINGGINDGKYIGMSAYSNGMEIKAEEQLNTISIPEGSAVIAGTGADKTIGTKVTIRYNKATGDTNERFRYYKSGQEPVQLYKLGGEPAPDVAVTGVDLNEGSLTIVVGGSETLIATVSPSNATNKNVTWSTTDANIATVVDGIVTGVAVGTATVTATTVDGSKQASCEVTVNEAPATIIDQITAIDLAATETSYADFSEVKKSSAAQYAGNSAKNGDNIQLRSKNSNSGIVSTVSGGFVKKVSIVWGDESGTVDIYGKNTAYTAATDLYDTSSRGTKIGSIESETSTEIIINDSYQYIGLRSNNGAIYIKSISIEWMPSSGPVAVTGIKLNKSTASINVGSTTTLSATIEPADATDQAVTWSSSNSGIASVDENGKVSGIAPGEAVITAKSHDGDYTASCTVTVASVAVTGVELNKNQTTITAGATETLVATVKPANATNKDVTWTSSNIDVATVENGVVTGVAAGDATITVKTIDGDYTATCEVNVTEKGGELKTWTYEVSTVSPALTEGDPVIVNEATWSIAMGEKVGTPSSNGSPTNAYASCGWKWGNSSSNYWKSYTLSTDYFSSKKVKSVRVNILNNGKQEGTLVVLQGSTEIGRASATFGSTWTDLTANTTPGAGGTLSITYTVAQASLIHSITVTYEN